MASMATPTRHLCRTLFQVSRRLPVKRKWETQLLRRTAVAPRSQPFSSTSFHAADTPKTNEHNLPEGATVIEDEKMAEIEEQGEEIEMDELEYELADTTPPDPSSYLTPSQPIDPAEIGPEELEAMKELLQGQPGDPIGLYNHLMAVAESLEEGKDLDPAIMNQLERDIEDENDVDFPVDTLLAREVGYWADGEADDDLAMAEDADDEQDESDITSVAHSELEVHREIREYTRVAAWDMPLLTSRHSSVPCI